MISGPLVPTVGGHPRVSPPLEPVEGHEGGIIRFLGSSSPEIYGI